MVMARHQNPDWLRLSAHPCGGKALKENTQRTLLPAPERKGEVFAPGQCLRTLARETRIFE
jgi:hypothetical protein